MRKAAFAGSFDPPTLGHLDIIQRAAKLFNGLAVIVTHNSQKNALFSMNERLLLLEELTGSLPGVRVALCPPGSLIVDFASALDVSVLIRGVRGAGDFEGEWEMAQINKLINPALDTVFLPTPLHLRTVRSSTVRELALCNADLSAFVSPSVAQAIYQKQNVRKE